MTGAKTNERPGIRAQHRYARFSAYKAREVLDLIRGLPVGEARAILALTSDGEQKRLARDVVSRGLSVRETEALVKKAIGNKAPGSAPGSPLKKKDVHTRAAEDQLRLSLGTPVEIRRKGKGGTIAITFANENELQRLYEFLTERK